MTTAMTPPSPPETPFDPDDDDRLIGRVLSRREVLALMGAGSVAVVVAACAPGSSASGSPTRGGDRSGRGHSPRPRPPRSPASLPSCVVVPELTEGPVLRQREPRPLRHPDRHLGRLGQRRRRPDARLGRLAGRRQRVHPARGRPRRRLALRRARQLLGRRQRAGPRLPARLPADRRERQGDDHDDLPGLVPGPRRPHPLQDPHRRGRGQRARVHVPAVLRRRPERSGLRVGRVRREGHARPAQRERRHLPAEPGHDPARRRQGRRRLQGHLRDRDPGDLIRISLLSAERGVASMR